MSKLFLPRSLDELWPILIDEPHAAVFAGGTDLLVKHRLGFIALPALVCLERIEELKGIKERGDELFIGSCSAHTSILSSPLIQRYLPVLTKALRVLGSPPIRNMGTIGGNICTASPAGDSLPPLYALETELDIRSRNASRRLPLKDFIVGPGKTVLQAGEILAGIWVKKALGFNIHHYEKVGQRKALAISIVSLAVLLRLSDSGIIEKARLAWGSVGPTIVTSPESEKALTGKPLSRETLLEAVPLAQAAVSPISDIRASEAYRKTVAGNLLLRLLEYVERRQEFSRP